MTAPTIDTNDTARGDRVLDDGGGADRSGAPSAVPAKAPFMAIAKELPKRLKKHNLVIIAAGIAFYATLALVPTIVGLISTYALVVPPEDVATQIADLTENIEDQNTAELIRIQVETAAEEAKGSGAIALTISIVVALFSASSAVQKLMATVTTAYEAEEKRKGWKVRGVAYLLTAGAIVGVVILSFLLGAVPALAGTVGLSGAATTAVTIAAYPIAFLAMAAGLTVLYRYGPDRAPKTNWINAGAVVGTALFLFFAFLFSLYFRLAGSMPASYGILGTIAALIIFFQLSTIAIVLGAETNSIIEGRRASGVADIDEDGIKRVPTETIPLGTAAAGLAAIFFLGKN